MLGRFRRRRKQAGEPAPRRRGFGPLVGLLEILATLVDVVTGLVAIAIAVGIAFVVLKANPHNGIVSFFHDVARWLVGPFDGMFTPKSHRLAVAINWGIAIAVYVIAGRLLAGLLRRPRRGAVRD
jgi:hypothetical protein